MNTTPTIPIPADTDMALEPSRTIGDLFANKAQLRAAIVAVMALVVMFGINIPADFSDNLTNSLNVIVPLSLLVYSGYKSKTQAIAQARETRAAVYAPSTVADLLGQPDIPAPPAS